MEEKKALVDRVHFLEHEIEKVTKKYLEAVSRIDTFEAKLTDTEKRAKSAEMKLRTLLGIMHCALIT